MTTDIIVIMFTRIVVFTIILIRSFSEVWWYLNPTTGIFCNFILKNTTLQFKFFSKYYNKILLFVNIIVIDVANLRNIINAKVFITVDIISLLKFHDS